MNFSSETKQVLDGALAEFVRKHDVDYAALPEAARCAFRHLMHTAQEYGYSVAASLKKQMIDSLPKVAAEMKAGYQMALRVISGTTWGDKSKPDSGLGTDVTFCSNCGHDVYVITQPDQTASQHLDNA